MQMLEKWCRGDRRLSDNKWDASCLWRPLQRATVGNCSKIWGANLRPDTFQCLILWLLHITIRRLQICVLHSRHRGLNQYFHTYCIWRATGLNLRYANEPPFSLHAVIKNVLLPKAERSQRWLIMSAVTSTVQVKFSPSDWTSNVITR